MKNLTVIPSLALSLTLATPALHAQTAPAKPAAAPAAPTAGSSLTGLDTNKDGKVTRAEWKGNDVSFAMQDTNSDGVLSGAELTPAAGPAQPAQADPAAAFAALDHNRDGSVTRQEWKGDANDFARLDHNADGKLTREEFLNLDRERERKDRLFRVLDKNGDGRISKAEWSHKKFDRLDRNRDGVVTREEFSQR